MAKRAASVEKPLVGAVVGVIMGSKSDWETMRHASEILDELGVPHECKVVSAHRTPEWMVEYAKGAEGRGLEVIIAGAGGAAHLPGMAASLTVLPVLGVPIVSASRHDGLNGIDSLLSIVSMPGGVPVGTMAPGKAGAINAGLLAAAILGSGGGGGSGGGRAAIRETLRAWRAKQTKSVLADTDPRSKK